MPAAAAIRVALAEESRTGLDRAASSPAQVEIAIAAGDLESAQAAVDELGATADDYGSPTRRGRRGVRARGAPARARGRDCRAARAAPRVAALAGAQSSVPSRLRVRGGCWDWRAAKLGDEDGAELALTAAGAQHGRLGAAREAARTAELLDRGGLPAGLTARELEVLRLVAAVAGDREIADELNLSVKTVARHLSDLCRLGMSSRTAATAFAYEHDLVGGHSCKLELAGSASPG